MKRKTGLLLLCFVGVYLLVHAAYELPELLHGTAGVRLLPYGEQRFIFGVADIVAASLFVIGPYLVLYRFYMAGKIAKSIILITATVIIAFFIGYWVQKKISSPQPLRLRFFFNTNLFFFSVYLVYGLIFFFVRLSWHKEIQQRELLLQSRQAELSFLRSQINPHFLFNSLSNIYSLVYENSPQALPAIAGLSELLRYMLYDNSERVPIGRELEYIQKYIGLQKLRFEHTVKAELIVNGETGNVNIPPLLLVPFIENAFKHGDFSASSEGLTAMVSCTGTRVHFYCYNKKGNGHKDTGGGIGLANIKRRLQLLYPGKHKLEVADETNSFTVNMELQYE